MERTELSNDMAGLFDNFSTSALADLMRKSVSTNAPTVFDKLSPIVKSLSQIIADQAALRTTYWQGEGSVNAAQYQANQAKYGGGISYSLDPNAGANLSNGIMQNLPLILLAAGGAGLAIVLSKSSRVRRR